jgi:GH25 family lysozyme M1 (1,4-beta-N-acetylmuramidase)
VDFAILRAGYRGYGAAGRLMEDAFFKQNIAGALENGVDVGVYFFSQATSAEEAEEEADFLLALLRSYPPERLALPVFFDWEYIELEEARTDDVANERMTDCALAFCERIRAAGYEAGIYAYRSLAYFGYDLSRIRDYPLWIGAVGTRPDFHYAFAVGQHPPAGAPDGVAAPGDLARIFGPLTPPATAAPAPAAG